MVYPVTEGAGGLSPAPSVKPRLASRRGALFMPKTLRGWGDRETAKNPADRRSHGRHVAAARSGEAVMARVTITVDDDGVFVDASCDDDEDLALTEALGIIELAKHTLIRQGMGE